MPRLSRSPRRPLQSFTIAALFCVACSHGTSSPGASAAGASATGGAGASTATGGSDAGVAGAGGQTSVVGALDGGVDTKLPKLPTLVNVRATQREDSVGVDFDPYDGAVDYRVYPLPNDSDVTTNSDGSVTIKNAIYHCAGLRQAATPNDYAPIQALGSPTLGYVYVTPGADRQPVYAVGIHANQGENGWRETRPKIYTTDSKVRDSLLAKQGRDDGIVFYVPSTASSATTTVYHSEEYHIVAGQGWTSYSEYYFLSGDLSKHSSDTVPSAPAFQVLKSQADGTEPLMGVWYSPWPQNHIELAVGKDRYARALKQGAGPLWHLEWSGLTKPTTLVVEALASGCPYQGFLSPESVDAPPHQPLYTLEQIQKASTTGEVFINGQYDLPGSVTGGIPLLQTPNASPVPMARSFVQVEPRPHDPAAWDWWQGFDVSTTFPATTKTSDPGFSNDGWSVHYTSSLFDIGAYSMDKPNGVYVLAFGQFLGQLWDAFDDTGSDVTGRIRFTALEKANIDSDPQKFLHVTWTVDTVGTDRRYPQLIVSDQPAPVEDGFSNTNGNFVLIQTIDGPSQRLDVEAFHGLVNGHPWAVNNQSTAHALINYGAWNNGTNVDQTIPPADSPFEHSGMDRMTKYDAYLSSSRLYVFMDGAPAGCTKLPGNGFSLGGSVTVTFGDVLYHEGAADEGVCGQTSPFPFMHEHQCTETKRHWDDLGFKSGVGAPTWDESNYPCRDF